MSDHKQRTTGTAPRRAFAWGATWRRALLVGLGFLIVCIVGLLLNSDGGLWGPDPDPYWQNVFTCILTSLLLIPAATIIEPQISRVIRDQASDTAAAVLNHVEDNPSPESGRDRHKALESSFRESLDDRYRVTSGGSMDLYDFEVVDGRGAHALVEIKSYLGPISSSEVKKVYGQLDQVDSSAGKMLIVSGGITPLGKDAARDLSVEVVEWNSKISKEKNTETLRSALRQTLRNSTH